MNKTLQSCERCKKALATQADTYLNEWLCENCYSLIGRITDDYQASVIDWDRLELLMNGGICA